MKRKLYEVYCLLDDQTWESLYFLAPSAKKAEKAAEQRSRRSFIAFAVLSFDDPSDVNAKKV